MILFIIPSFLLGACLVYLYFKYYKKTKWEIMNVAELLSCWQHLQVYFLIRESDTKYIVYLDKEKDIDWEMSTEFEQECAEYKTAIDEICAAVTDAECQPYYNLDHTTVVNYKRFLAEALVQAFEGKIETAKSLLQSAENFLIGRKKENSRYLYLCSETIMVSIVSLVGFISWLYKEYCITQIGENGYYLCLSAISGALGTFLFIILRLGNTTIDYNATKKLHLWDAFSKLAVGMISGFLVGLCINGGIILPILSGTDKITALLIGGLLAGASEKLVPSIIGKIDAES